MAELVVVRGGGDLGSGVAIRLHRVGFRVVILETQQPVAVRRTVCFSEAVYDGVAQVEEVVAALMAPQEAVAGAFADGCISVVVDPSARLVPALRPGAVVDAIMAKRNHGTRLDLARTVIALGPGFVAGEDAHAVVETNRGPDLGRVIWEGAAEPDTGTPGMVDGRGRERVLRAPVTGTVVPLRQIGEVVREGDTLAEVAGVPVTAPFGGLLRGMVRGGRAVASGSKIGDLDPRPDPALCRRVSDKSLAVAGGVLEALLMRVKDET